MYTRLNVNGGDKHQQHHNGMQQAACDRVKAGGEMQCNGSLDAAFCATFFLVILFSTTPTLHRILHSLFWAVHVLGSRNVYRSVCRSFVDDRLMLFVLQSL